VGQGPLRWRFDADALEDADGVIHRPECADAHGATPLRAGAVIERMRAPGRCRRCYPEFELLLGHISTAAGSGAGAEATPADE
jgi:hypothetical protein